MPVPTLPLSSRVQTLIQRAYRRSLLLLGLTELAQILSVTCIVAILMLILGTQILNWYWLVLAFIAAGIYGFLQIRRKALSRYQVAQVLDQRLGLSDTLSTALFVKDEHGEQIDAEAARFQQDQAERAAESADIQIALPFQAQRRWLVAGALTLAFLGLFSARYLVSRNLDLRQSMVPLNFADPFHQPAEKLASLNRKQEKKSILDELGFSADAEQARTDQNHSPLADVASVDMNGNGPPEAKGKTPSMNEKMGNDQSTPRGENLDGEGGEKATGDPNQKNDTNAFSPDGGETKGPQTPNGKNPQSGNQSASNSLLDKMRDAMSSLMSKLSAPNSQSAQMGSKTQDNNSPRQNNPDSQNTPGEKGEQGQSQQNSSSNSQANADPNGQNEQEGEAGEKAQSAQAKRADKASDRPGGSDAHSGIGQQNGEKALQDAKQLEAMGKLAEIIGKRSADLTGEVMVEVPSGKQQLNTQYTQKQGTRGDGGGEINRDEVPLIYQQYVREYMEQVRKNAK